MTALEQPERISVEDYLQLEETSDERHEYLGGYVVAMAGESKNHQRTVGNLFVTLSAHLRGQPCEPFLSGIKVHVDVAEFKTLYYYPDIVVDCGVVEEPEPRGGYVAVEPKLIIEVLSPTSSNKDEVEKYLAYQYLTSLDEYLVVSQNPEERYIRLHRKEANWRPDTGDIVVGSGTIHLQSIDLTLDLDQIYDFS